MAIYDVTPDNYETFSVLTRPERTFISSSNGVTGSISVFQRRSKIVKDPKPDPVFVSITHDDKNLAGALDDLRSIAMQTYVGGGDASTVTNAIRSYMSDVHSKTQSARNASEISITRWTQAGGQDAELYKKLHIKDVLIPHYKGAYPSAEWGYVGYHCLNFYSNDASFTTPALLLYPQVGDWRRSPAASGLMSGSYILDGEFSLDFHINVRHNQARFLDVESNPISTLEWNAGTIMHLSGCYALSLHSGSQKGPDGNPVGFRLALGLISGSQRLPSDLASGVNVDSGDDLLFFSEDDALQHNHWHRVVVRWGTSEKNSGTGSFNVDGVDRGTFVIDRSTVNPARRSYEAPDNVLFIGNFYEGPNTLADPVGGFFSATEAERYGFTSLRAGSATNPVAGYNFKHPAQCELHDILVRRQYLSDTAIQETSGSILSSSLDSSIGFYLGPHYLPYSPHRKYTGGSGGIPLTPFQNQCGSTVDPYNVGLFGTSGIFYTNLENYCLDLANSQLPRFVGMSPPPDPLGADYWKALGTTSESYIKNVYPLQVNVTRRNDIIAPCDDGTFLPDYSILSDPSGSLRYTDDSGRENKGLINLSNVYSSGSKIVQVAPQFTDLCSSGSLELLVGPSPDNIFAPLGMTPGWYVNGYAADPNLMQPPQYDVPTSLYNKTLDESSAAVVGWNISNLFYGQKISPGTVTLTNTSWVDYNTGIPGVMTLRDDGVGGLYRADCESSPATWASVGTVFYDEGVILIKSPNLYKFGETSWTLNFKGESGVHVLKIDAIAPANELNVSRNPTYQDLKPSDYPNDPDSSFVYITCINFHDDNLNVVMKAQLAQPVIKRTGSRIVFRPRIDF